MDWNEQLDRVVFGNSLGAWAASGGFALAVLLAAYLLKAVLGSRLRARAVASPIRWREAALLALDGTGFPFIFALALYLGTQGLQLPSGLGRIAGHVFFVIFCLQLGIWISRAVRFLGESWLRGAMTKEPGRAAMISTLVLVANLAVWATVLLMALANFGVNVSALVTGLGIGGVAVALAVQNILGDLFSSLSILLDKPFVVGDSIQVNGLSGTVERIGLKTTHIRSITGEQLIFSNSDLLKNVVRNYKRMARRRATLAFGLEYETPPEKLHRARELAKEVVGRYEIATFDRCHLATLAASSLDFELVYWLETSDYGVYADTHHKIAVSLLEAFAKEGLEFAYPHQVHLEKKSHA